MQNPHISIVIRRSRIVTILVATAIFLLFVHSLGLYFKYGLGHPLAMGFVPLFNLDTEGNIPTFYSSTTLLLASLLFYWNSRREQLNGSNYLRQWRLLPPIFFYLALDEAAKIHELLIEPLRSAFHLKGIFYFSWVIVGAAVVILLGGVFFRFVTDLPSHFRLGLLLAGALYIGGAVGLELVGGNYASVYGQNNLTYELIATLEELLEISGVIVLINALLKHLQTHSSKLEFITDE